MHTQSPSYSIGHIDHVPPYSHSMSFMPTPGLRIDPMTTGVTHISSATPSSPAIVGSSVVGSQAKQPDVHVENEQVVGLQSPLQGQPKRIRKAPPCGTGGHKAGHKAGPTQCEEPHQGDAVLPSPYTRHYTRQHKRKGSYGVVYKARDLRTSELVAIKVISLSQGEEGYEEICGEIEMLQQCSHPNVVHYLGSYQGEDCLWIVMEYCGGGSVADLMNVTDEPLGVSNSIYLFKNFIMESYYEKYENLLDSDFQDFIAQVLPLGMSGKLPDNLNLVPRLLVLQHNLIGEVSLWILPILLKSAKARKDEILASVSELKIAKENLPKLEGRSKLKPGLPKYDGKIDYTHDFFACQAFLTVSGQLQVESYACALTSVYTFGPLKAENSHTSSHLAEFWMVKPEIAFAELKDDMNCAEAYVRFLCQWLLDNCLDDMEFMADKSTLNTKAFQNAIFYLNSFADKGGAKLFVPAGQWFTRSFDLISHLTLWLDKDAVILGSTVTMELLMVKVTSGGTGFRMEA
ncbi:asparagine--trna ligase [Quercus suber]|uniref:Asparagine--trna ligase n=1 Tax=Quercus suber TaxID=58331 RepID=A0AAW0KTW8_QUESU